MLHTFCEKNGGTLSEPYLVRQTLLFYIPYSTKVQFVKSPMQLITLACKKELIVNYNYFSCKTMYHLKVSVIKWSLKENESNWLIRCEKLKKEFASFHVQFGWLILEVLVHVGM